MLLHEQYNSFMHSGFVEIAAVHIVHLIWYQIFLGILEFNHLSCTWCGVQGFCTNISLVRLSLWGFRPCYPNPLATIFTFNPPHLLGVYCISRLPAAALTARPHTRSSCFTPLREVPPPPVFSSTHQTCLSFCMSAFTPTAPTLTPPSTPCQPPRPPRHHPLWGWRQLTTML